MLGIVRSASLLGVDGHAVTVEVHLARGLPSFSMIGLPDTSCREARDRVRAALMTSKLPWPDNRVTVNLAPPTVRKVGSAMDLAIAVAVLVALGEVRQEAVGERAFLGELGLDGQVRPVPGTICLAEPLGRAPLVLPEASATEGRLVGERVVHPVRDLLQVVACLRGEEPWPEAPPVPPAAARALGPDLRDVRGQPVARYALEVAAAGGHHLLLLGPPGAGKTMLASRLPGLLPGLSDDEAVVTTRIHSAAGLPLPPSGLVRTPPFRAPHHGASAVALVGGGSATLRPGEISTATACVKPPPMTKAAIYVRISRDREGSGLGVARQEKECRALAGQLGWAVAEVLVDNDTSAYRSRRRRPGYERLLAGLRDGSWDAVVAWHPDRLHRSNKELEPFIDAIEGSGAQVATVRAGIVDLSTAAGRLSARVVGAAAQYESEVKAERIRSKHAELAEAGRPVGGGTRPFGYADNRMTLDPAEAALVREAAQRVLDGVPVRAVCRDWTARGVPTVKGSPWTPHVLKRVLTAPRTAALRVRGGKEYPGTWEPILDVDTWRRVRAVLLDPGRRVNVAPRTYLLTGGLARCGLCDRPLVARPHGHRSYVCASGPGFHGCGRIRIKADDFEADVRARALAWLETGQLPEPAEPTEVTRLLSDLEGVESAMAELAVDYYTDRSISKAQFQAASVRLDERKVALYGALARCERRRVATVGADAAEVLLMDEPDARQRATVEGLIESVRVGPAVRGRNRYDHSRVEVSFLGG